MIMSDCCPAQRLSNCDIKQPCILVLAPNPWTGPWVNRQQLFSRIGSAHTVLYSNGGWFSWDRKTPEWRAGTWRGEFSSCDNVWVDKSPKFLTRVPRLALLDEAVLRAQVHRWKRFFRRFHGRPLVLYVFHPLFMPYVNKVRADYVVYHAYDMYDHTPGWSYDLEFKERALLNRANMVVASSAETAEGLKRKMAREIRVLPNGADVGAFDKAMRACAGAPYDLHPIPKPRIGYFGTISQKVDVRLIADLARRRPEWNFIFVGRVLSLDALIEHERRRCAALPNVHFLGEKNVREIPLYVTNMDVNVMCYQESDHLWTKWIYPLKLHEYLAAGRPIVSADLPSIRPFKEVVRIASGVDEWEQAIEQALLHGGRGTLERRRQIAAENSWDVRVATLQTWLSEMVAATTFREMRKGAE